MSSLWSKVDLWEKEDFTARGSGENRLAIYEPTYYFVIAFFPIYSMSMLSCCAWKARGFWGGSCGTVEVFTEKIKPYNFDEAQARMCRAYRSKDFCSAIFPWEITLVVYLHASMGDCLTIHVFGSTLSYTTGIWYRDTVSNLPCWGKNLCLDCLEAHITVASDESYGRAALFQAEEKLLETAVQSRDITRSR